MIHWYMVHFEDAKSHLVCASLKDPLIEDLARRGSPLLPESKLPEYFRPNPHRVVEFSFDLPGMVMGGRPQEEFQWCSLKLTIPSEDVQTIVHEIERLERRYFVEKPYYKLHGYCRCIVVNESQRRSLYAMLKSRVTAAEARADEFVANWKAKHGG